MRLDACVARRVLVPILLLGVSACALFDRTAAIDIRTVQPVAGAAVSPDDALYSAAVRAISARDYALALDYLQAARQKQPSDIRVLNGFGVVYDKLGRFDLSARYYAEAGKLDPQSPIVAANLAYSAVLQGRGDGLAAASESAAVARPAAPPVESNPGDSQIASGVALSPSVSERQSDSLSQSNSAELPRTISPPVSTRPEESTTRVAVIPVPIARPARAREVKRIVDKLAASVADGANRALLTGAPLTIVNASGKKGASEPVRLRLTSLGWTAPPWAMKDGGPQAATMIHYMPSNAIVAHALARTLPFPSQLVACSGQCGGLHLVLGRDVLKPRLVKSAARRVKRG